MIIDCHSHVFAFPKIKPTPFSRTTFLSAEQQISVMDDLGIDKAIILPMAGAECPTETQSIGEILHICRQYPGRFIPFCNIDPRLPKRPDLTKVEDFDFLLEQYKELGCRGIGELTVRLPWDHPQMLLLLEACEKVDFPVTFHTITPDFDGYGILDDMGLPKLEKVLKMFPRLKFFAHSTAFWNEISGDVTPETKHIYPKTKVTPGGRVTELMRKYPNLYGDISANSGLMALTRDPEHAFGFIEEFQDRILLGLDTCSTTNVPGHIEWFKEAKENNNISESVYEKIMWKNINKVLNLGLEKGK